MSAPPPLPLIVLVPMPSSRVAISWMVLRALSVPEKPNPDGLKTPLSYSNIST